MELYEVIKLLHSNFRAELPLTTSVVNNSENMLFLTRQFGRILGAGNIELSSIAFDVLNQIWN